MSNSKGGEPERVLIVEDEPNARLALTQILEDEGYRVESVETAMEALDRIPVFEPAIVLTDIRLPGGVDGLELLRRARGLALDTFFVMMTAYGSIQGAVDAMRLGAENYVTKPINFDALKITFQKVMEKRALKRETRRLREELESRYSIQGFVGVSPLVQDISKIIGQAAATRTTVLIVGESGTGKELIARALHFQSPRREKPFIKVTCPALSPTLLESELFGHEKGAFTGADRTRQGRFEIADGGTLFLDEISEIPDPIQVKLLRFLQDREFERVGGNKTFHVDVRILAATNRDIEKAVTEGRYREDLFYRLNVITIRVPPLRERASDIPALVQHFIRRFCEEDGKQIEGIEDEAMDRLMQYPWPGNVRELENAVERAVVMAEGPVLTTKNFPAIHAGAVADLPGMGPALPSGGPAIPGSTLEQLERHAILKTLERCGGSTTKAARVLGISARKIQYRLREYGIEGAGVKSRPAGGTKKN